MNLAEKFYNNWIKNIAKGDNPSSIKRHIIHHAKQLRDPKTNAPLSWAASMYNLLKIYEEVYNIKSTVPIQTYKLLKKYNKNPRLHTPPPGGNIPKNIKIQKVEADSRVLAKKK